MLEGVVGQPRRSRQQSAGPANLQRDEMQRGRLAVSPVVGRGLLDALRGATELLEHDQATGAEAVVAYHARDRGRGGWTEAQDDQPAPGLQRGDDDLGDATRRGDELRACLLPAQPRARKRER